MKAEIVSIGTEILLGQITDTNAAHLASQLPPLGIDLYWISQVGDNLSRIVDVLSRGWARSDLILTTGGLGPTQDDVTREAIAQLLGEEVRVDATLERDLREQFRRWGYRMPEANIKQAWLIPSSQPIPNPRGTAPGWWVERDGRTLVAMPGPPGEMTRMWQKEVTPRLKERVQGVIILSKTLKTLGIGEGSVDEMLGPLLPSKNPTVAVYAKPDGIHIRITSKTPTEEEGRRL
ncbi:MAG: molybdopterin-binding protein, partial [Dehalococcoidia bacterium]